MAKIKGDILVFEKNQNVPIYFPESAVMPVRPNPDRFGGVTRAGWLIDRVARLPPPDSAGVEVHEIGIGIKTHATAAEVEACLPQVSRCDTLKSDIDRLAF